MATQTERLDWILSAKDNATSVFRDVDSGLGKLEKSYAKLSALFAVGLGAGMFNAVISEASKAEEASNRLNAVLKATGFASGHTKGELDEMANSLHELTQFEDESVRAAEATLLKFGNIHGNTFREALKLSADYAAFVGGDMAGAAQTFGKALNAPQEGLKGLQNELGRLLPTQKAAIDDSMEMNNLAGAQGVLLEFVRGKIAGTAEMMNTGYLGATSSAKKAWGEFLETLGRSPAVSGSAAFGLEVLKRAVQGLDDAVKVFTWENLQNTMKYGIFNPPKAPGDPAAERQARLGAEEAKWNDAFDRQGVAQGELAKDMDDKRAAEVKRAAEENLAREKRLMEEGKKSHVAYADFVFQSAMETDQALAKIQEERNAENDKQLKDDEAKQLAHIDKTLELEQQLGLAANDGMSMLQKQQADAKKLMDVGKELGLTFTSAFEDAALKGKGFGDVLKGLEQDIARIILRKGITEPVGGAISKAMEGFTFDKLFNFFGGGKALGGPVSGGTPYLVGERGPELFVPGSSGSIVPNGAGMGQVNLNVSVKLTSLDPRGALQVIAPLRNTFVGWVNQAFNERGRIGPLGR